MNTTTKTKVQTVQSNIQIIEERAINKNEKSPLKQLRNIDSKHQHSAAFKVAILGFILSSLNTSSGKRLERIFFDFLNMTRDFTQRIDIKSIPTNVISAYRELFFSAYDFPELVTIDKKGKKRYNNKLLDFLIVTKDTVYALQFTFCLNHNRDICDSLINTLNFYQKVLRQKFPKHMKVVVRQVAFDMDNLLDLKSEGWKLKDDFNNPDMYFMTGKQVCDTFGIDYDKIIKKLAEDNEKNLDEMMPILFDACMEYAKNDKFIPNSMKKDFIKLASSVKSNIEKKNKNRYLYDTNGKSLYKEMKRNQK